MYTRRVLWAGGRGGWRGLLSSSNGHKKLRRLAVFYFFGGVPSSEPKPHQKPWRTAERRNFKSFMLSLLFMRIYFVFAVVLAVSPLPPR